MALGGQLQAPAGGEIEQLDFADDQRHVFSPQGLLHRPEGFLIVAAGDHDHAGGIDPVRLQSRRMEVLMGRYPQAGPLGRILRQMTPQQMQGEEGRLDRLLAVEAGAGDFMQGMPEQAAAKMPVRLRQPQGEQLVRLL